MFFSSVFSILKQKSSFLASAATITSATTGAVVSYLLLKKDDIREKIEALNKDLEKVKRDFEIKISDIKNESSAKISPLIARETKLREITVCIKKEMQEHDERYTSWGVSDYKPNIANCEKSN